MRPLLNWKRDLTGEGQELPVIFIGDQMLSGDQEVMGKLDPLILEYQMMGGLVPPLPPLEIASAGKASEKTFSVDMAYFYQKGCPKCDRASYLLNYISKKYPHLNVTKIDLNSDDGKRLNETLSTRLNLPPEKRLIAPTIFIGNDSLSPEEITETRVEALIEKYEKGEITSALKVEQGEMKKAGQCHRGTIQILWCLCHPAGRSGRGAQSLRVGHAGFFHLLSNHDRGKTKRDSDGRSGFFRKQLYNPLACSASEFSALSSISHFFLCLRALFTSLLLLSRFFSGFSVSTIIFSLKGDVRQR